MESWTGATGGPGSQSSPSALHLMTALHQEGPMATSALTALLERNCEYNVLNLQAEDFLKVNRGIFCLY